MKFYLQLQKLYSLLLSRKIFFLIIYFFFISCKKDSIIFNQNATRIAFGSCGSQNNELPIFNTVATHQPDLFIFLGDNIYGDTEDMQVLRNKYNQSVSLICTQCEKILIIQKKYIPWSFPK